VFDDPLDVVGGRPGGDLHQIDAAAQDIEARAEAISNVTYTAPTETGESETTVDQRTFAAAVPPVGRNEPCPCGSGKKYKHCHGALS
jgi:preprotein translocase subunit SecA